MLWRIQFADTTTGWVEVGTGRLFDDVGVELFGNFGYTPTDTEPEQPAWYTPPPDPEPYVPPVLTWDDPNLPPEYHWIDVGPFFDRFGAAALGITSSADAQVQGLITLILPRQYVDLKRADVEQMVGLLVLKGLITAGEMGAVLSPQTTEWERHVKGLQQPE